MSEGMNRVFLFGHLGADPELRYTATGRSLLSFRMATTESYVDRDGIRQQVTDWHRVTVWGKRAEALSKILARGRCVMVEGRIRTTSYEKNGEKRYMTEIVATDLRLPPRGASEASAAESEGRPSLAFTGERDGRKLMGGAAEAPLPL